MRVLGTRSKGKRRGSGFAALAAFVATAALGAVGAPAVASAGGPPGTGNVSPGLQAHSPQLPTPQESTARVPSPQASSASPHARTPRLVAVARPSGGAPLALRAGQFARVRVDVANTGGSPVSELRLLSLTGVNGCAAQLAPWGHAACDLDLTVSQEQIDAGQAQFAVRAAGSITGEGAVLSPWSSHTVALAQSPGVTVVATAPIAQYGAAGERLPLSVAVSNVGNTTLSELDVTLAAGSAGVSGPSVTCPTDALAPGGVEVCSAAYVVSEGDLGSDGVPFSGRVLGSSPDRAGAWANGRQTVSASSRLSVARAFRCGGGRPPGC